MTRIAFVLAVAILAGCGGDSTEPTHLTKYQPYGLWTAAGNSGQVQFRIEPTGAWTSDLGCVEPASGYLQALNGTIVSYQYARQCVRWDGARYDAVISVALGYDATVDTLYVSAYCYGCLGNVSANARASRVQ